MTADPEAVARRLFGVVLRHVRTEAGLSLRELGKRCHHDYSRLSRMETGEHVGNPALIAEIDRILGAGVWYSRASAGDVGVSRCVDGTRKES